jgi:branched-chain amino acid transport system permease protein
MNTNNPLLQQSPAQKIGNWLKSTSGIIIILTIIAAVFATIHKGTYVLVNTVVLGGIWALMAMGLALGFLIMNIPNFAFGEFFMIGTLVAYFIFSPIHNYLSSNSNAVLSALAPIIAIIAAFIGGGIAGAIIEKIVFTPLRKKSRKHWIMNCFVLTLGISVILINAHQLILGTEFKGITKYWDAPPIEFFDVSITFERVFAFILAIVAIVLFWIFLKYTRFGKAMRAVAEDETGALIVGINYNVVQTITMGLSAAMAALAGATLLFMFPSTPTVGVQPLYYSWFVIIVVGMGNISGAIAGGFIVALLQVITRVYIGEGLEYVVPSAVVIIILVFKPSGIFGAKVRGIWDK